MRHRHLGAALAACLLLLATLPVASADIVDLRDGKRVPDISDVETPWGEPPSDEELEETRRYRADLAYDRVSVGRESFDAANVVKERIWISAANQNQSFIAGETYGFSGFWPEAAQAFNAAAADLDDAGKEVALYKAMLATRNTGDTDRTLEAADRLLATFPKTLYFGPAQELRARIFASRGELDKALQALNKVIQAQGMNAWDLFSAKYLAIWLSKYLPAQDEAGYAAAEQAFRDLLREMDTNASARKHAAEPRHKAMASLAGALRAQGKSDEARQTYERILQEATDRTGQDVLAPIFYGLGDLVFEQASALQEEASGDESKKAKVKEMLEEAAMHYLRVHLLYAGSAGERELYGARRGAARVFAQLFRMSDEQDCELASRAYDFYREAVAMQDRGEERRVLIREGRALKERMDAVCSKDEGEGDGADGEE